MTKTPQTITKQKTKKNSTPKKALNPKLLNIVKEPIKKKLLNIAFDSQGIQGPSRRILLTTTTARREAECTV